jgi:hypothetical protein
MKRKDYITEEKSSIEHMSDILATIIPTTPVTEFGEYLIKIPTNLWPQIEALDTLLKGYSGYEMGVFLYGLVKQDVSRVHKFNMQRTLENYVCYNFDYVWSDAIEVGPESRYQTGDVLTTARKTSIQSYIHFCDSIGRTAFISDEVENRYIEERYRIRRAEGRNI